MGSARNKNEQIAVQHAEYYAYNNLSEELESEIHSKLNHALDQIGKSEKSFIGKALKKAGNKIISKHVENYAIVEKEIQEETAKLNKFFEEVFNENMMRSPTWQTYVGLKTNYDKLNDETEAFEEESIEILKKNLKKLKQFDYDALDKQAQISYDLFKKKWRRLVR